MAFLGVGTETMVSVLSRISSAMLSKFFILSVPCEDQRLSHTHPPFEGKSYRGFPENSYTYSRQPPPKHKVLCKYAFIFLHLCMTSYSQHSLQRGTNSTRATASILWIYFRALGRALHKTRSGKSVN